MHRTYTIEPIGPRTIDKAYPLAKVIAPDLLQLGWRQFCQSCELSNARLGGEERIVVALNAKTYVKGLCIYAIRGHATYGQVLDVPFFVTASAADGEGVASALVDFLRVKCNESVCSGIRFWTMNADTWARRSAPEHIARSDHGLFMPALASAAEMGKALCAHAIEVAEAIDQLSR
jgi:hypothetical protein